VVLKYTSFVDFVVLRISVYDMHGSHFLRKLERPPILRLFHEARPICLEYLRVAVKSARREAAAQMDEMLICKKAL
jgi:hypothetical protein